MKIRVAACWLPICFALPSLEIPSAEVETSTVTVEHLGHTCFLLTDAAGNRLVTDPYLNGFGQSFPEFLSVDLVTVSALTPDHDAVSQLRGNPVVLDPAHLSGNAGGFEVEGFPIGRKGESEKSRRCGYVIRHGSLKLLFLGEIGEQFPDGLLERAESADGVLVGLSLGGAAWERLTSSRKLRTLFPAWIAPSAPTGREPSPPTSTPPAGSKDWPYLESAAVDIGPNSPRQIVTLRSRNRLSERPAAPDESMFADTLVQMTWPQVQRAAREGALVLVPVGVIEEHGPHIGLGVDSYLVCLHCRRIKGALAASGNKAVIAPPFYWGITDDTSAFPGSFNVRPETMTALITDLCRSLQSWGFQRLVFVNDHGNINHRQTLKNSLSKVRQELKLEAYSLETMLAGAPVYQAPTRPDRYQPDYHAGAAETALVALECPSQADTRLAQRLKPQPEFSPLGYVGDPASFRKESSLSDFFLRSPEYDARRIEVFFALKKPTPTQAPDRAIDVNAQMLIDGYIESSGGRAKLKAIRTQIRHGSLREGGKATPLRGIWSAPGKWLLVLDPTNAVPERFGFTGSVGWHLERGQVGQLPEPLVMGLSLALDPQLALRLESLFMKLPAPREERSGDRHVKLVEGQTTSGMKALLTFETKTGLLIRINETVFDDYREVEGVWLPFAVTIQPGTQIRYERIENNVTVDEQGFDPPQ